MCYFGLFGLDFCCVILKLKVLPYMCINHNGDEDD